VRIFSSLTHPFALLNLYDIIISVEKIKHILIEMYILRIHINNLHKSILTRLTTRLLKHTAAIISEI